MAFSISKIKSALLRRIVALLAAPPAYVALLFIGALMGIGEAHADFRSVWRGAWNGR